jgi:hypothetical protein
MEQIKRIAEPLYKVKGWMMFAGVLSIIQGILSALSVWGIIIAWIPIWLGVLLCSASNYIGTAFGSNSEKDAQKAFEKLGTYFKIYGIFMIAMIVLGIIAVVAVLAAIAIPAFLEFRQRGMGMS